MERRAILGIAGSILGLSAGCIGAPAAENSTRPPTDDPTTGNDTATSSGPEVLDIVAGDAVAYHSMNGSSGVLAGDATQYVVAALESPRNLSADSVRLRVGGEEYSPGLPDTRGARNRSIGGLQGRPIRFAEGDSPALASFVVPSPIEDVDGSTLRVRDAGSEHSFTLPAAVTEALSAPPPNFVLESFAVPENVERGSSLDISITATNTAEVAGQFLAAVHVPTELVDDDNEVQIVSADAPAGGTVTESLSIDTQHTTDERSTIPVTLEGVVSAEREVAVAID